MKVAIFYDWLNQWGGAERVLLNILKIYPNADLYTLVYDPQKTSWLPKKQKVFTSFINYLPFSKLNPIFYTPIYDIALEKFDFSGYDLVISATSVEGHCLLTPPQTLFVCFFHNINRHLYSTPKKYFLLQPLLKIYRHIDKIYSRRPDLVLCNSKTVSNRIQKHYQINPAIINPGINTGFFCPSKHIALSTKYFLIVSRLVPHKKIDLAIKACLALNQKLIIVGTGRDLYRLKKISNNNPLIQFVGQVKDSTLVNYYQNCQALICPQLEDFGITPLEAQACGKPVIAYGRGGNLETISQKTGVFFHHQTTLSLVDALKKFNTKKFNSQDCRHQAEKFSEARFMLNFKKTIDQQWAKHQNKLY
ncbi:glycosyltransferase [Candidatus Shapirobacteria bacterium]|nr:glycosyltransferase [Candidatus Shapirobacteria bacterium]